MVINHSLDIHVVLVDMTLAVCICVIAVRILPLVPVISYIYMYMYIVLVTYSQLACLVRLPLAEPQGRAGHTFIII